MEGIIEPILSPIETATSIFNLGKGIISLAIPGEQPSEKYAVAVGEHFKNRYGGLENLKKTIAEDPAGFLLDASTVLTGGGTLAARSPGMIGAIGKASQRIDPVTVSARAARSISKALPSTISSVGEVVLPHSVSNKLTSALDAIPKLPGKTISTISGDLLTRTGAESVEQAFRSGKAGGEKLTSFLKCLRQHDISSELVEQSRDAVAKLKEAKNIEYTKSWRRLDKDKDVLDFDSIEEAVNESTKIGKFKDKELTKDGALLKKDIQEIVDEWKNSDPELYHTPAGIDALKQKIYNLTDTIPSENRQSRLLVGNVYNAIKDRIKKEAPFYSDMMKDYENASTLIREIEHSLTGKSKTPIDTSIRKLQSIFRNNVSTNYGYRTKLAEKLEDAGADTLRSGLAGQAMSSWMPRGLGSRLAVGGTAGAAATLSPTLAALLPFLSPRLTGEVVSGAGRISRTLEPKKVHLGILGLHQAGLLDSPTDP